MNGHLSSEQISQWMMGERTPAEEQHARECPACAAELARLEAAIVLFRNTVSAWSEERATVQLPLSWHDRRAQPSLWKRPWCWAAAAVALLLLALLPAYTAARDRQRKAAMAKADAVLIEQVDADISRAVPASMEPLVQLVSWGSGSTADETNNSNRSKRRGVIR